jgi:hypothetical protein
MKKRLRATQANLHKDVVNRSKGWVPPETLERAAALDKQITYVSARTCVACEHKVGRECQQPNSAVARWRDRGGEPKKWREVLDHHWCGYWRPKGFTYAVIIEDRALHVEETT